MDIPTCPHCGAQQEPGGYGAWLDDAQPESRYDHDHICETCGGEYNLEAEVELNIYTYKRRTAAEVVEANAQEAERQHRRDLEAAGQLNWL